jgi:hypothetical protein
MFTRRSAGAHAPHGRIIALLFGAALAALLAACDNTSTNTPSVGPSGGSLGPSQAAASADPGSPGASAPDFGGAADALAQLTSYSFSVAIQAENTAGQATVQDGTTTMSGTVVNQPEPASSLHLVTADQDGAITDETEIVILPGGAYLRSGGASARWNPIPADQADAFTELATSFRPEQMFSLYFAPTGSDSTVVGEETRNGVASTHYRGGEDVAAILGEIAGVNGSWRSNIWLANDGGYLVAAEARVQGSPADGGGSFSVVVDITDINAAGPIKAPI